jgi:hypothetical protein
VLLEAVVVGPGNQPTLGQICSPAFHLWLLLSACRNLAPLITPLQLRDEAMHHPVFWRVGEMANIGHGHVVDGG